MYLFKHTKRTPFVQPRGFGQSEIRSIRCLPKPSSHSPNELHDASKECPLIFLEKLFSVSVLKEVAFLSWKWDVVTVVEIKSLRCLPFCLLATLPSSRRFQYSLGVNVLDYTDTHLNKSS